MELFPRHCGAPSLNGLVVPPHAADLRTERGYRLVGGHLAHDLGRRHRLLGAHVEPPRHRLDPVVYRHPAVAAQQLAQPRVQTLYPVVRRWDWAARGQFGIEEGEQLAGAAQLLKAAARLPQPLVLPAPAGAVGLALLQERVPPAAPGRERREPLGGGAGVRHLEQILGDAVQLDARLQVRPGRRAPLDLPKRMKRAPLHARVRPMLAPCLLEAGPSVADDDVGRGDPGHERAPRRRALASRQVPAGDALARDRDQHHARPPEPYAVDVDDVQALVADRGYRPDFPIPLGLAPERSAAAGHRRLGRRREQPIQERLQPLRRRIEFARGGRAAGRALPALGAGGRGPVAFHFAPAHGACHLSHGGIEP